MDQSETALSQADGDDVDSIRDARGVAYPSLTRDEINSPGHINGVDPSIFRPLSVNGLNTVEMWRNSNAQRGGLGYESVGIDDDWTLLIACHPIKPLPIPQWSSIVSGGWNNNAPGSNPQEAGNWQLHVRSGNWQFSTQSGNIATGVPYTPGVTVLFTIDRRGGDVTVWHGSTEVVSATSANMQIQTVQTINRGRSILVDNLFGELIIAENTTPAEVASMTDYAKCKWGIA